HHGSAAFVPPWPRLLVGGRACRKILTHECVSVPCTSGALARPGEPIACRICLFNRRSANTGSQARSARHDEDVTGPAGSTRTLCPASRAPGSRQTQRGNFALGSHPAKNLTLRLDNVAQLVKNLACLGRNRLARIQHPERSK